MPRRQFAVVRRLWPAIAIAMVAGCGTLPLNLGRSKPPPQREPGLHAASERDGVSNSAADGETSPWRHDEGERATDHGSQPKDTDAVASLNAIIDREFPGIDDTNRRRLIAEFRSEKPDVAKSTLRMLGGQWRMNRSSQEAESSPSSSPFPTKTAGHNAEFRRGGAARHAGHTTEDFTPNNSPGPHPDAVHDDWDSRGLDSRIFNRRNRRRGEEPDRNPPRRLPARGETKDEGRSGFGADIIRRLPFTRRNAPAESPRVEPAAETVEADWNRSLQRLIELTDRSVRQNAKTAGKQLSPKDELLRIREHVYLRMMYLMSGKTQNAIEPIPGLKTAEQEFWQNTLWGLSKYFQSESISDRGTRSTQTVERFRKAVYHLRNFADLEVPTLTFCRKITNYGNYETVAKPVYRAGEQALIYAEIENFTSQLTKDGRFETRIQSTIEIYDDNGRRVAKPFSFDATKDICRQRRRDYFHSYVIDLPQRLAPGNYLLKLTVKDELGDKLASDKIRFQID